MTFAVVSTEEVNEASAIQKFYEFLARNPTRLARVLGEPDIKVTATTTTNDTGTVYDLTANGYEFPANSMRLIRTRAYFRGDVSDGDDVFLESNTCILGGATPAVTEATVDAVALGDADFAGSVDVSVSTANVICTVTGVTSVPANWEVHIFVGDIVYISGGQA